MKRFLGLVMTRGTRFGDGVRVRLWGIWCVYCGEVATEDEHFPPATFSARGFILPACSECNRLAGTEYGTDFEKRSDRVKDKIRSKYARAVATPDWSPEEIGELGRGLRSGVVAWNEKIKTTRRRLAWSAVAYLQSIDHNNDFVPVYAEGEPSQAIERASWRTAEKRGKSAMKKCQICQKGCANKFCTACRDGVPRMRGSKPRKTSGGRKYRKKGENDKFIMDT